MNSVLELNGRWTEGNKTIHQITIGLQHIHPIWVVEGGIAKDVINGNDLRYFLSMRFHF